MRFNIKEIVEDIYTELNNIPVFETVTHTLITNLNLSNGSVSNATYHISKAGYMPIGIVGHRITTSSGGSGAAYAVPFAVFLENVTSGSADVHIAIRANGGAMSKCAVYVFVLWKKI